MRNSVAVVLGLLVAGGTGLAQQYLITTVAGGPLPLPVLATKATLGNPVLGAVDSAGNLYFIYGSASVFRIDRLGVLTRAAGNSTSGYSGDGGPATAAQLNGPQGVAVDTAGNLYIADTGDNAIRKVAAATGLITTVAGNGVYGDSGDGGPAASAQLSGPSGVALDGSGNLYIVEFGDGAIRRVDATTGIIAKVASTHSAQFAVDAAGNLYFADFNYNVILRVDGATGISTTVTGNGAAGYSGDGGPATSGQLNGPTAVVVDSFGNLYIATYQAIRKVAAATGILTTIGGHGVTGFSGDGGPAIDAGLDDPQAVAVDSSGNLYIADSYWMRLPSGSAGYFNGRVREVAAQTDIIMTVAGNGVGGYSGDGGPATSAALGHPPSAAVDRSGNLYIADEDHSVIRKVTAATGIITTVAGTGAAGFSGDGGPATSAELGHPNGVAVDSIGNLYISNSDDGTVRKVTAATGIITTVFGPLGYVAAVAVDGSDNLYILAGNTVGKMDSATGKVTTLADSLINPHSLAVDNSGNIYVAEAAFFPMTPSGPSSSGRISKVSPSGSYQILAGSGGPGYSGDGGPAISAQLSDPWGVAVDAAGNIYVADTNNSAVRMLTPMGTRALLSVAVTHSGNFARQAGATYSVVVSNAAGTAATSGAVTVTETLPTGLTLVSMGGTGWSCSGGACSRLDALLPGASYPPITVAVNVAVDAPLLATNQVTVSGGGSRASGASDPTEIAGPPQAFTLFSPANGATGALVAPTLLWNASEGAVSYDVHFGTSSSPPLVTSTTGTSYVPGTLTSDTTYYWQIVAQSGSWATGSAIWSFTTGVAPIGSRFVPVAPCRVADTRRPSGPFGGPSMTARSLHSFAIPSSGCGIPATAHAYSLNVTVVPEGPLGYLTLWPAGRAQPVVSTLNSPDGIVVANAAIVPAGAGGAVSVFVTDQTDVVLDINGYFDTIGAAGSSMFYAATPCRVADTRGATGQFGGPAMVADQVRDFPIPLSACGIPAAATAYSLNVTAIPGTDFLAYLTAFPTGSSRPFVSTLNSWAGEVRANAALVPVGANDSVSVFVTDPANVILDINGYFGQPGGAGELAFYPVTPCRAVDTRGAAGPFGGPEMEAQSVRSFAIPAGGCPVPSNAAAYSLNVTVVPDGPLPYLTAWPAGAPQPNVSTLNSFDGSVVANAAIVPAGTNGAVSIYVTDRTQVILDINGYFAP